MARLSKNIKCFLSLLGAKPVAEEAEGEQICNLLVALIGGHQSWA